MGFGIERVNKSFKSLSISGMTNDHFKNVFRFTICRELSIGGIMKGILGSGVRLYLEKIIISPQYPS